MVRIQQLVDKIRQDIREFGACDHAKVRVTDLYKKKCVVAKCWNCKTCSRKLKHIDDKQLIDTLKRKGISPTMIY
jgi:hypothetical protein